MTGTIAIAAVLSMIAPAVTAAAPGQEEPSTKPGECILRPNEQDRSHLRDNAAQGKAITSDGWNPVTHTPSTEAAAETAAQRRGPRRRPFVTALLAVPLITYAGAMGPRDSEFLTPADRFAVSQLIGAGYVVNPRFRFGVMGVFSETLTGLPPAADTWQFGGIAPIAIGTFEHFIIGGGPIIGYRSAGKTQPDAGVVVLSGASIPLGNGLALNIAAPVTALFKRRVTVSVGLAVGVAKVF